MRSISSPAIRLATRLASNRKASGLLTVFVFHKVLSKKSISYPEIPDKEEFARILNWISDQFNILRLEDAVQHLECASLPNRAAAITFDDGNADTLENTSALFKQKNIPATFFVNTAYLEGGEPFFERIFKACEQSNSDSLDLTNLGAGVIDLKGPSARRRAAERLCEIAKYMPPTDADIFSLRITEKGKIDPGVQMVRAKDLTNKPNEWIDFGGHSHSHSILTTLPSDKANTEIIKCRNIISDLTGNNTPLFAYPNGKPSKDFTSEHEAMVRKAGFKAAFSCSAGAMQKTGNRFSAPRFTAWDTTPLKFQLRMLLNLIRS